MGGAVKRCPSPGLERLRASWAETLAAEGRPKVALADGADPRAVEAAAFLESAGLVEPCLVGRIEEIADAAVRARVRLPPSVRIVDIDAAARDDRCRAVVDDAVAGRGLSEGHVEILAHDPVWVTAALLGSGQVDAAVAGATRPTADVLRAGIRLVGLEPGVGTVSSCFLMVLPDGSRLAYADCAVVPDPSEEQLADIAVATSRTFTELTGQQPRVAMLSFSTAGSAAHASVAKVRGATEIVRAKLTDLDVDGELQFDAAVVASVGNRKAPGSSVAGHANVLIFPNLDAGNIAYKITERLGGAVAIGPILQGLAAPLNDLSRGCSVTDIVNLAMISAVQASTRDRTGSMV